jgi:hypothetical protein
MAFKFYIIYPYYMFVFILNKIIIIIAKILYVNMTHEDNKIKRGAYFFLHKMS